jgi:hypothetical protein
MNLGPVRFRPHVDGRNTTARVSRGAAGRRRDGRSPRSGLGRAGSASRPSMRPTRRTGTATARPSVLRGPGTVDIRSTTVRCRRSRPHACTGVDLRSSLGGHSLLASRSTSCRIRSHVVPYSELSAGHLAKRPTCALAITRVDKRYHRVGSATSRRHVRPGQPAVAACSHSGTDQRCRVWSFSSCATSSPSPRSCTSGGRLPASTSSSPR